ncbi:ECF transporter S component [Desulfurococcus amylolyticus]
MSLKTRLIVETVVFAVLVYAATIVLQIYQPATGGYFNLGESMIYVAALASGPVVAGIAGGVGAALADLTTGYQIFAPGTLVIKLLEGLVAGYLARLLRSRHQKIIGGLLGAVYASVFTGFALVKYSGIVQVGPTGFEVNIPWYIWLLIGMLLGFTLIYSLLTKYSSMGEALALLTGGMIMVTGYFLYEYFISNPYTGRPPIDAVIEIPVNIGQAITGIVVALPVVSWLRRAGYLK